MHSTCSLRFTFVGKSFYHTRKILTILRVFKEREKSLMMNNPSPARLRTGFAFYCFLLEELN
ncbi:hypothetical protein C7R94_23370 [Brevibacillus sp. NRRL NRS-603]|nr:hypothetical protein C7R94_23370 [Brevibacillus sp. NRRL NRS-603]